MRKTVSITPQLKAKVEGPYHDAAAPVPVIKPGVYPSIAQAEQVVSIAGIRNAASAYFRGEVDKIGGAVIAPMRSDRLAGAGRRTRSTSRPTCRTGRSRPLGRPLRARALPRARSWTASTGR